MLLNLRPSLLSYRRGREAVLFARKNSLELLKEDQRAMGERSGPLPVDRL